MNNEGVGINEDKAHCTDGLELLIGGGTVISACHRCCPIGQEQPLSHILEGSDTYDHALIKYLPV